MQVNGTWGDADEPIRAVPDPWAQARTFGEALLDSRHTLHRTVLAQWRGLLATFALRTRRADNYRLSGMSAAVTGNSTFEVVMSTLTPEIGMITYRGPLPDDPRDRDEELLARSNQVRDLWRNAFIYQVFDGQKDPEGRKATPFAMSNPICLVSPGRDVGAIRIPGAFWADGGLSDPLNPPAGKRLTLPEVSLLKTWLENLRGESLDGGRSTGLAAYGQSADAIRDLLKHYIKDCDELGPDPEFIVLSGESEHVGQMPDLFKFVWATVREGEDGRPAWQRSRAQLHLPEPIPGVEGIVFADVSLLELSGIDPHSFRVWGDYVLEDVLSTRKTYEDLRAEMARQGWWLIDSKDLFTDRAVILRNDPHIEAHPRDLRDMILPVRPLALLLSQNLESDIGGQVSGTRATVSFTLSLKPEGTGEPRRLTVKKFFTTEPIDNDGLLAKSVVWDLDSASYWPDFQSKSWNTYLARFSHTTQEQGKRMALPRHGISRPMLFELARLGQNDAIKHLTSVNNGEQPNLPDEQFRIGQWLHNDGKTLEMLQRSSLPYEAFVYTEEKAPERSLAFAGLVLTTVKKIEAPTNRAKVAVDFGTTSTVACVGDIDAAPITFKDRLRFPIRYKDPDLEARMFHSRRESLSAFIPPEDRQAPIDTVANARIPYNTKESFWAFRNLIYFYPSQPPAQNDEQEELKKFHSMTANARFDLKWSDEGNDRDAAADYLEQFMTMVSAELIESRYDPTKTEWLFSAPEAMSLTDRKRFFDRVKAHVGNISPDSVRDMTALCSEGICAARYMKERGEISGDGVMVTLDIGGGTTDVTMWDREEPVWRGSVKLAGQDFFTRLLCQNPEILERIGLSTWAEILASTQSDTVVPKKKIANLAEMLFSGRTSQGGGGSVQSPLEKALDTHWINRVMAKDGALLRHTATVFIGGIAWYVGRVARHLIDSGALDPERTSEVAFAVCGRGGGLFKRMHGGERPERKTPVTLTLSVFGEAAGLAGGSQPEFAASPAAKLEVVRGMLADYDPISPFMEDMEDDGAKRFASHDMLSGLKVQYRSGRTMQNGDIVTFAVPGDKVEAVEIDEIELFLKTLADKTGLHVELSKAGQDRLRKDIREELDKAVLAAGRDKDPREMEPPFVTALRVLVTRMAGPANERDGLVETREASR